MIRIGWNYAAITSGGALREGSWTLSARKVGFWLSAQIWHLLESLFVVFRLSFWEESTFFSHKFSLKYSLNRLVKLRSRSPRRRKSRNTCASSWPYGRSSPVCLARCYPSRCKCVDISTGLYRKNLSATFDTAINPRWRTRRLSAGCIRGSRIAVVWRRRRTRIALWIMKLRCGRRACRRRRTITRSSLKSSLRAVRLV